jgi:hypothetical protein
LRGLPERERERESTRLFLSSTLEEVEGQMQKGIYIT